MIRQPHFVQTNLHRSKCGTLNFLDNRGYLYSVELYSSYVKARFLKVDVRWLLESTSQGLCVFYDSSARVMYVINPVTMQRAEISGYDFLIPPYTRYSLSAVCDRQSGEVKLVLAFAERSYYESAFWYVQKLGSENSWKKISAGHLVGGLDLPAISIAGFLIYVLARKDIVVLDVSDETVHKICSPTKVCPVTYRQMGKDALSCISHDSGRIFIHALKEFPEGNWSLYKMIDYGDIPGVSPKCHYCIGWIGEELLLRFSFTNILIGLDCIGWPEEKFEHFTYNLKTKKITPDRKSVV